MEGGGPQRRREGERAAAKGGWTAEEDAALRRHVAATGACNWAHVARALGGRTGKSCRLRWRNHLAPEINTGPFTADEDRRIVLGFAALGPRWAAIAKTLPGRTRQCCQSHWNSVLKKRYPELLAHYRSTRGKELALTSEQTGESEKQSEQLHPSPREPATSTLKPPPWLGSNSNLNSSISGHAGEASGPSAHPPSPSHSCDSDWDLPPLSSPSHLAISFDATENMAASSVLQVTTRTEEKTTSSLPPTLPVPCSVSSSSNAAAFPLAPQNHDHAAMSTIMKKLSPVSSSLLSFIAKSQPKLSSSQNCEGHMGAAWNSPSFPCPWHLRGEARKKGCGEGSSATMLPCQCARGNARMEWKPPGESSMDACPDCGNTA